MDTKLQEINDFLVTVFNDILTIEESELQKSKFNDLSIKEFHTIEAIGLHDEKTSSEVAKSLSITVGTLTVAINNLEKKGYVERIRDAADRRVVKLKLTNKGRLVFRVHQHFHKQMVMAVMQGLDGQEQDVLIKALKNLHAFLIQGLENNE